MMMNQMVSSVFRTFLIVFLLQASFTLEAVSGIEKNQAASESDRPNILFILADDLGWADLRSYGSTFYETPNLDRLAEQGMRFTDAYSAGTICSPTRASLMTGKYPGRLNTTDFFGAPQPGEEYPGWWRSRMNQPQYKLMPAPYKEKLPLEEVTLAEALKQGGYATFFAGKWHLGPKGYWPEQQGFDVNIGGYHEGHPNSYFSPYHNPEMEDGPKGEHLPMRLARETARFMEQHKKEPFLAYLSFYSVHRPLQAPDSLVKKYRIKKEERGLERKLGPEKEGKVRLNQTHPVYAAMVESMDRAVGLVFERLEEAGLKEETIVIFTSDNGGLSTTGGYPTSNEPLRAGKRWLYEGGIRVPLIVRWPGVTEPGTEEDEPVTSTDFYPTMLEMAGLEKRPQQHIDGVSLVPLLKGQSTLDREAIYWHHPHNGYNGSFPGSVIRQGKWKLIHNYEDQDVELYNLEKDLREQHNVADSHEQKVIELYRKLDRWRNDVDARSPIPNPEYEANKQKSGQKTK